MVRHMKKALFGALVATLAWGSGWSMSVPSVMDAQAVHAASGDKHIFAGANNAFVTIDSSIYGSGPTEAMGLSNAEGGTMIVPGLLNWDSYWSKKISAGAAQTVVLGSDGKVWAVGRQGRDELYRDPYGDTEVIYTDWTSVYGLSDIVDIAAGSDHALAVKKDGTVWAWGYNEFGQLGVPSGTVTTALPMQVAGLGGVKAVSAGDGYSLALKTDGTVWGFGINQSGELGLGTTFHSTNTPQQVYGLTNVVSIDAGSHHALAVLEDGTVWGWGNTLNGQVNQRNQWGPSYHTTPQQIALEQVKAVSAGENFSLALKQDGTVWAFGSNEQGALGQGGPTADNLYNPTPLQIPQLSQITEIAAGDHFALARKADNSVFSWGENKKGQLGIGSVSESSFYEPTLMKEPLWLSTSYSYDSQNRSIVNVEYRLRDSRYPIVSLPARYVMKPAGISRAICDGPETNCTVNVRTNSDAAVFELSAYDLQTGALIGTTQIRCSNDSDYFNYYSNPQVKLAAGEYHSLWLKSNGTLFGFGLNSNGQLGDGTRDMRLSPVPILSGVIGVAAGDSSTLVRKSNASIWAFGGNSYGELGIGNTVDQTEPVEVAALGTGAVGLVSLGSHHAFAGIAEGPFALEEITYYYGWGLNQYGQLGTGSKTDQSTPALVHDPLRLLSGSTSSSSGFGHTLFISHDGKVYAIGRNDYGQLGNRTTTDSMQLVEVPYLSNVVAISAGPLHSAALTRDGSIYTWGYNVSGQLGDGTFEHSSVPVKARTGAFNVAMDSGRGHMISTASDGSVWTWGYNFKGQLGNGTRTDSAYPAKVPGLTAADVSAGGERSAVIQEDGSVYMFGSNSYGELGDGTRTYSTTPVMTGDLLGLSLYVSDSTTSSLTISTSTLTPVAKRVVKRNGVVICHGTCANFVDSGLTAFTPYTYTVEAYDAVGKLLASKTQVEATQASNGLEGFEQEYFQEDFYPLQ